MFGFLRLPSLFLQRSLQVSTGPKCEPVGIHVMRPFTDRMPFLTPNRHCRSTANRNEFHCKDHLNRSVTLDVCASSTSFTICERALSAPTCVARIRTVPCWLSDPPMTSLPGHLLTGNDSPVINDSSHVDSPSNTRPSTGIFSPGNTWPKIIKITVSPLHVQDESWQNDICSFRAVIVTLTVSFKLISF